MTKRRLALTGMPQIEVLVYDTRIRVTVTACKTATLWTCSGELSPHCAVNLIKELRRALRKVRDHQIATLTNAVNDAEGPL